MNTPDITISGCIPPCDWLMADESFQQAGVGLVKSGWVYGWVNGGSGENGEALGSALPQPERPLCTFDARASHFVTHKYTKHTEILAKGANLIYTHFLFFSQL